jgi:hypothetical protein
VLVPLALCCSLALVQRPDLAVGVIEKVLDIFLPPSDQFSGAGRHISPDTNLQLPVEKFEASIASPANKAQPED